MRRVLGRRRHFDCLDSKEDDPRSQIEGANLFRNHSMRGCRSLAIVFFTHESRSVKTSLFVSGKVHYQSNFGALQAIHDHLKRSHELDCGWLLGKRCMI